jgi:hypothetical protein
VVQAAKANPNAIRIGIWKYERMTASSLTPLSEHTVLRVSPIRDISLTC